MNFVDVLIAGLVVMAAVGGYRLGFVTRVFSWIGLAIGLVLGIRFLLPWAVGQLPRGSSATAFMVALLVVVICGMLGQALGFVIGAKLRPPGKDGQHNRFDRALGGLSGLLGAVLALWLLLPLAAATPGWVSSATSNSFIAQNVDKRLPPAPDTAGILRSIVGDQFPQVFDTLQPTPDLGPPPALTGLTQAEQDKVARSVVKIQGNACNRIQDGSGWVAAPEMVVTNAHVVAGESATQVQRDDSRFFDATVLAFDPQRDLAILRVPKLDRPALPTADAKPKDRGGVFGHPGGEPLRVAPFEVSRQITALGRDIYGQARTERQVLELKSALRPGDSGSAIVDPAGEAIGVAFAVAPDQPTVAYALAMSELRPMLANVGTAKVDTGPCIQ
ncbi:MAG: MarP family serine protease [Actinobacteria bacterium]|nr:MarP family serine protease [Actinomycetota bacterium]